MDLTNLGNEHLAKLENSSINNKHKPLALSKCLEGLKQEWDKNKNVASLWQDWPKIAGKQLSSNCTPLPSNIENKITLSNNKNLIQKQWVKSFTKKIC